MLPIDGESPRPTSATALTRSPDGLAMAVSSTTVIGPTTICTELMFAAWPAPRKRRQV
jgi:hypothetical protein